MVELKVVGQERHLIKFDEFKTMEEYFIYLFLQEIYNRESVSLKNFCDNFNLKLPDVKEIISRFAQQDILKYQTIVNPKQIILEVELMEKAVSKSYSGYEELLNSVYYFPEALIATISEKMNTANDHSVEYLKNMVLQILKRKSLKVKFENLQIDSAEDSLYFLKNFAPHEIFASWNLDMTDADNVFIFENIFEKSVSKELVNLAIDYTIKTNLYHAFNSDFAQKNINQWINEEFVEVEEALNYIREQKERAHAEKMKGNYVAPSWDDVSVKDDDIISAEELEKLLNE